MRDMCCGEWDCASATTPGLIESMDAAGFAASVGETARCTEVEPADDASPDAPGDPGKGRDAPVLDLRQLPAPEPFERAFAAVETLGPGATLVLLTPLLPTPLLQALAARGFDVQAGAQPDGSARVSVRAPG